MAELPNAAVVGSGNIRERSSKTALRVGVGMRGI